MYMQKLLQSFLTCTSAGSLHQYCNQSCRGEAVCIVIKYVFITGNPNFLISYHIR